MNGKYLDWLLLISYCGLIFFLSAQQKLPVPPVFDFQDKFLHAGAYFVMAVFSWRAFRYLRRDEKALAWTGFLFCCFYGVSDEWHQSFVPGRSVSVWDWAADTSGAALANYLIVKFGLFRVKTASVS